MIYTRPMVPDTLIFIIPRHVTSTVPQVKVDTIFARRNSLAKVVTTTPPKPQPLARAQGTLRTSHIPHLPHLHPALHTRVSSLVHQEVQKLADIPGMRVELVLYWVPANYGVTRQKEAGKIAMKCRKNGKSMFFVNDEERPSEDLPKSVSLLVRDVLILERLRINKERRANGKASPATTTHRKVARAIAEPAMNQDRPALSPAETLKTQLQEPHPNHSKPRDPPQAPGGQDLTTEGEERADKGCHNPLEEQALVDRQLLIETYEHHIRYCKEMALPGRSIRGTQQLWKNAAESYCFDLEELVPDHPLTRVPRHPLLAFIFSSP
ncbi:uncharacterized protein B0T23DRAFT_395540 [Neurospora hispaniola]|uniref:Uncharacterized protein n=1 Tax=Neurospora hispaniola TaxID=588809 RepID=A0AAJ0I7I0_9PEZI|nr:hypothetical protein B0T23DRAFT_395540 [Neurospora hispaniola]